MIKTMVVDDNCMLILMYDATDSLLWHEIEVDDSKHYRSTEGQLVRCFDHGRLQQLQTVF